MGCSAIVLSIGVCFGSESELWFIELEPADAREIASRVHPFRSEENKIATVFIRRTDSIEHSSLSERLEVADLRATSRVRLHNRECQSDRAALAAISPSIRPETLRFTAGCSWSTTLMIFGSDPIASWVTSTISRINRRLRGSVRPAVMWHSINGIA
jgi:hypothetical protein